MRLIHKTYTSLEERDAIIAQMQELNYVEFPATDHFTGKGHLLFRHPVEPVPPRSTHFARIDGFNETDPKPLRVTRTWQEKDYTYDCFVTQNLVDQYQAGQLAIGDWVIVHYDEGGKEVAMMKVFKSW